MGQQGALNEVQRLLQPTERLTDGISACDLVSRLMVLNRVGGVGITVRAHVLRIPFVMHVGTRRWSGAHPPARRRRGAR